jgi:hypothetical protein
VKRKGEVLKGGFLAGGAAVEDRRMQMGSRSSAGYALRFGMLFAVVVLEDLNRGLEELIRGEPRRWGAL